MQPDAVAGGCSWLAVFRSLDQSKVTLVKIDYRESTKTP